MVTNLNSEYSGIETQEDASRLITIASEHVVRARISLESAADSAHHHDETVLLLKVASRFTPLADAMKQLSAAFAQRSM